MIRLILACYPKAWRRAYGEEFAALLEQTRLTPRVVLDVLAQAAKLHASAHRTRFFVGAAVLMSIGIEIVACKMGLAVNIVWVPRTPAETAALRRSRSDRSGDPSLRPAMISPRRRGMSGCRATPAFATDRATGAYYEQRGGEYEEWYTGEGLLPLRGRSAEATKWPKWSLSGTPCTSWSPTALSTGIHRPLLVPARGSPARVHATTKGWHLERAANRKGEDATGAPRGYAPGDPTVEGAPDRRFARSTLARDGRRSVRPANPAFKMMSPCSSGRSGSTVGVT